MAASERTFGTRLAVVGAGVSGAALALAVVHGAQRRRRAWEVALFHGGDDGPRATLPLLLTAECRTRLAALGVCVPREWRTYELKGVEVIARGRRALLHFPSTGVWVVDPGAGSGPALLASLLRQGAEAAGIRVHPGRVLSVLHERMELPARLCPGELVVRWRGRGERFHRVALATGAGDAPLSGAARNLRGAPTVARVHTRLRFTSPRLGEPWARLLLGPLPGMDGLLLLPCGPSVVALGYGERVGPADLCQALMLANRDGLLADGFEVMEISLGRLPSGRGKRLAWGGILAAGGWAMGHPLQVGIADGLRIASRAAAALLDSAETASGLQATYGRELQELPRQMHAAARAQAWLLRAGPRAAAAVARAYAGGPCISPLSPCLLGLPSVTPSGLLRQARLAAAAEGLNRLLAPVVPRLPLEAPLLERNLFYIVDDDDDTREALAELLRSRGARVVAFRDELSLYASVARRPPAAILLDVVLPWVDGLRLCEGLKASPLTAAIPVYVMSGLDRPPIRQRAIAAGARAFLPKPLDPMALLRMLGGACPGSPGTGASGYEISA